MSIMIGAELNDLEQAMRSFKRVRSTFGTGDRTKYGNWTIINNENNEYKIFFKGKLIAIGNGDKVEFLEGLNKYEQEQFESIIRKVMNKHLSKYRQMLDMVEQSETRHDKDDYELC